MPSAARRRRRASARSSTRTIPQSIIASVKAGCSEIEHGLFADEAAIKAMKDANVYFDPNIGLVLQNYLENKDKFMGSGNFNDEGFASMERRAAQRARSLQEGARRGPQDADGHRRRRRRARPERARDHRARRGRAEADGRDHRRDVARRRVAAASAKTIGTIAPGLRGRHRRRAGRPAEGHHGAARGEVRDEGRTRLQEVARASCPA